NAADLASFTKDDHMHYFTAFIATLLGDFSRYLDSTDQPDLVADGVGYTKLPVYLSDEEFKHMATKVNESLLPLLQNKPAPGRRRRIFASISMPAPDAPESES